MGTAFPTLPLFGLFALALGTLAPRILQPLAAVVLGFCFVWLTVPEPTRSASVQRWLEARYDRSGVERLSDPAGIIVAGGGLSTYLLAVSMGRSLDDRGSSGRITGAAALAKRFPQAKVIHAGLEQAPVIEVFNGLGVVRERIVVEDRSSTTFENATFTAALLRPQSGQRWILVTSASHMPRAMATFRSAGFDVVAYPVDFEADPAMVLPGASMLSEQMGWPRGRREVLAILGYALTGRISLWQLPALVLGSRG